MKTVPYRTFQKALTDLQRDVSASSDRRIEVYEINQFSDEPIQLGVNWSAIGTVPAAEAQEFAQKLMNAAVAAENFKYNGYTIDWED